MPKKSSRQPIDNADGAQCQGIRSNIGRPQEDAELSTVVIPIGMPMRSTAARSGQSVVASRRPRQAGIQGVGRQEHVIEVGGGFAASIVRKIDPVETAERRRIAR